MARKTKRQIAAEVRAAAEPQPNGHTADPPTPPPPDAQTYDQVVEEPVEWLLDHWIPYGSLTLLTGPSRAGKSTLLTALCAHVCGGPRLDGSRGGVFGRAVWWGLEEVASRQILPRLRAAEVPREAVYRGGYDRAGREQWRLSLPVGLERLRESILALRLRLVVVDPLTTYLSDGIDPHLASCVRPVLEGLEQVAHQTGAAIVGTVHDRKDASGSALDHVAGSGAWVQVPRTILRVGYDPQRSTQRVLSAAKTIVGVLPPSRQYAIVDVAGVGRMALGAQCALTADDLSSISGKRGERDAARDAQLFLRHELAGGPVATRELQRLAQDAGLSWKGSVYEAKETLKITAHRVSTLSGWHYEWRPPEGGFVD